MTILNKGDYILDDEYNIYEIVFSTYGMDNHLRLLMTRNVYTGKTRLFSDTEKPNLRTFVWHH